MVDWLAADSCSFSSVGCMVCQNVCHPSRHHEPHHSSRRFDSFGFHGLLFAGADAFLRFRRLLDFFVDYVYCLGVWRFFGMVYRLFPAIAHLARQGPAGCHFFAPFVPLAGAGTTTGLKNSALVCTNNGDHGCGSHHYYDLYFCTIFGLLVIWCGFDVYRDQIHTK